MNDLTAVRTEFIEKIGLIAQGDGMPRIAGRIFGLLLFDGQELSFGAISKELQVSRGSVSTSVRMLQDRGLIKRVAKPGDRQDYFRLADNPYVGLLEGAKQRTARAGDEIAASLDDLPGDAAEVRDRLDAYARFYRSVVAGLDYAMTELTRMPAAAASRRRSVK